MSITIDQICSINQRLDELTLDICTNLTINKVGSKINDLTLSLETSQTSGKLKIKSVINEKFKNLGSDLKEKTDT